MNFPNLKCCVSVLLFAAAFCVPTTAQTAAPVAQSTASETFELNIVSERITETNFARSTAVELTGEAAPAGNSANVRLEVGVAARAERIDVILRGITGRVTFRGSLDVVRRRIEQSRRDANPPAAIQP